MFSPASPPIRLIGWTNCYWSAQEFVDTELGALCVCLKYVRTDAAEMAVPPNRIVE